MLILIIFKQGSRKEKLLQWGRHLQTEWYITHSFCGCEFILTRRACSLYSDLYQGVLLFCSSSRHRRSCSYSTAHATILILLKCKARVYTLYFGAARASRSVWLYLHRLHIGQLKQGVDDSIRTQPVCCRFVAPSQQYIWSCSAQIIELLTVNWVCQHAQLIQRLCQAIVNLCIEAGGPDSPYTAANGRCVSGKMWLC